MTRFRWLLGALVVGLGLTAAPFAFQMFSRAPAGGEMIDDFRRYMTTGELDRFEGYLDVIGAAEAELGAVPLGADPPAVAAFRADWPTIDSDMGEMLSVMRANLDNFAAVDALPPFALFPWFFVAPGLIVAALALLGMRSSSARPAAAVAVMGIGIVAAPAVFQMFERAPMGADMIEELGPYMTRDKVTDVQGYFLTLGAAEGGLRNSVGPTLASAGVATPAISAYTQQWPEIANNMAPMVGVMADNLEAFAGIDALPPFGLFPWFFVIPGAIVAAAGVVATALVLGGQRNNRKVVL